MALTQTGDKIKVRLDSGGQFGSVNKNSETGIVVEIPQKLPYLGFHSFAFEASFGDPEMLEAYRKDFYEPLLGRRVYWGSTLERGAVFEDTRDGIKYAFLLYTDILASDDGDAPIAINQWEDKASMYNA